MLKRLYYIFFVNFNIFNLLSITTVLTLSHLSILALAIFLPVLWHSFLNPKGRHLMKTSHLGPSIQKSPIYCILSDCGSLYSSYLLKKEVSLMMTKQGTDLCYSRMSLRAILLCFCSSRTMQFDFTVAP